MSHPNPNRADTNIPTPNEYGALQSQPNNPNPLYPNHFQFNLNRIPNTTFWCQKANLPSINITAIDQVTVFNPIKRPGGAVEIENLNISFVVDEDLKNWKELRRWILECSNDVDFNDYKEPNEHLESSAVLFILESNNQPRYKVTFEGLFPVKLDGIQFRTDIISSENIYCDCTFAFTNFEITNA